MKIAVSIQCHKNPRQINLLLNEYCYVHIDKKAGIADEIRKRNNVFILSNEKGCLLNGDKFRRLLQR